MKWIQKQPRIDDKIRLFCFSYAGGGASIFAKWNNHLSDNIGVYPIQLPGHEDRIMENPINSMNELIEQLYVDIATYMDKPCVFFGHSVGARIAYAFISNELKAADVRGLIVSASPAPDYKSPVTFSMLDDIEFIKEIRRLGGTPKEILNNRSLMEVFLPILKADYCLDENYKYPSDKLDCNIWAITGTNDVEATEEEMSRWSNYTNQRFMQYIIKGSHFFIRENEDELLLHIDSIIAQLWGEK